MATGNSSSRARRERGPGESAGALPPRAPGPRARRQPLHHSRVSCPAQPPKATSPVPPFARGAPALPVPRSRSSPRLTAQQRQQQDAEQGQPAEAARGSRRSCHRGRLGKRSRPAHGGRSNCAPRRAREAERTGARAPLQQPQSEPEPEASRAGAARRWYLRALARRRRRQAPPRDAPSPPAAERRPAPSTPPPRRGGEELAGGGGVWRWIGDRGREALGSAGDLSEVGDRRLCLPPILQGLGEPKGLSWPLGRMASSGPSWEQPTVPPKFSG